VTASTEFGKDGACVVLTAIDGSRTSLRAGAYAAGIARRQQARLVVVYVERFVPSGHFVDLSGAGASFPSPPALAPDELHKQVLAASPILVAGAEFVFAKGDPCREIVRVARSIMAEVIVVGAPESRWHRWTGSLATGLVRAGCCPVTVVP
jgi:nucleotide-binding universal stress UspA family protein